MRTDILASVEQQTTHHRLHEIESPAKFFKADTKIISEASTLTLDTDEKTVLAARSCPTKAIILEKEGTLIKMLPDD